MCIYATTCVLNEDHDPYIHAAPHTYARYMYMYVHVHVYDMYMYMYVFEPCCEAAHFFHVKIAILSALLCLVAMTESDMIYIYIPHPLTHSIQNSVCRWT